jgi:hypothetical protein
MSAVLLFVGAALAVDLSAPFGDADYGSYYPTAYYDHGGVDWACGSIRYSGHRGNDFGVGSWAGMDAGRDIVAAASGTVVTSHDGEYDRCTSGECAGGSGYGNYVSLRHADGTKTYYAHMKKWTVAVSSGQTVNCGDKLGEVGSSGYSTGPHLHFEPRSSGNVAFDPFHGSCSSGSSRWVSQGSHGGRPAIDCGSSEPVVTDHDGDGYDEADDCNDGNAAIHPGATEICDNGVDEDCDGRVEVSSTWYTDGDGDGYGAESRLECGDQPGGTSAVDGDCDDSHAGVHPGAVELCDGLDNDCNGEIDDGPPTQMGEDLPDFAAQLVDLSAPGALAPGSSGAVWAAFENVGAAPWRKGDLWLMPQTLDVASPLHDEAAWAAWDVLAVLDEDVPPDQTGLIVGHIRVPDDATGTVTETFTLVDRSGTPVRCPAGEVTLNIRVQAADPANETDKSSTSEGGGCTTAPAVGGLWLIGLLALTRRRR